MQIAPGQELHFNEVLDFEPWNKEFEYRRHMAIAYPLSQFDALIARIRDHGGELIDEERAGDPPRIFFRDPNGYLFEVVGT